MDDEIYEPSHYTAGIEVIDFIKCKLTKEEYVGFCLGNVIKYVSRWHNKGGIDDLKKASVYLGWAIEKEEETSSREMFSAETARLLAELEELSVELNGGDDD